MTSPVRQSPGHDTGLIWHELECGSYTADLALWEELAEASAGRILDLGCGSGRVALHLAARGATVTGVDTHANLVAELNRRARDSGLPVRAIVGDACELQLGEPFDLVLAPMQLIQMLPDVAARARMLAAIAGHLAPGGRAALALVEPDVAEGDPDPPLPDVRERDGWIYSSLPVAILDSGDRITVRRLRQTVSPEGRLTDQVDEVVICAIGSRELAEEARLASLVAVEERLIGATKDHVGSTVLILEA